MKMNTGLAKGLLILAVALAVLVPVGALAVPGRGGARTPKSTPPGNGTVSRSATATIKAQSRHQRLQDRIAKALGNRSRAFDRAATRIAKRIDDVAVLADKAGLASGDVSGVKSTLDDARAALLAAKSAEAVAIRMFKDVPDAASRRTAFEAARAKAREARSDLGGARVLLRSAILKLEAIVSNLPVTTP